MIENVDCPRWPLKVAPDAGPLRLVILVSDCIRKLQAIQDSITRGQLNAEIVAVVCNRQNRHLEAFCRKTGIALRLRPWPVRARSQERGKCQFESRQQYDGRLAEELATFRPDLLILAWWMHVFSARFLDRFEGRVINVHPALPGMFPGARCTEDSHAAISRGEIRRSGVMVHFVVEEVDAGPVIGVRNVSVQPNEPLDQYERRLINAECELLVEILQSARQWMLCDR